MSVTVPGAGVPSTTAEQRIDRLGTVLEDLLATNRHILARLNEIAELLVELNTRLPSTATGIPPEGVGRSSVEIKSSVRGVDAAAKAFDGSDIKPLVGAAVDAYFEALAEAQRRLNDAVR
jgi:hypothetical protein